MKTDIPAVLCWYDGQKRNVNRNTELFSKDVGPR